MFDKGYDDSSHLRSISHPHDFEYTQGYQFGRWDNYYCGRYLSLARLLLAHLRGFINIIKDTIKIKKEN